MELIKAFGLVWIFANHIAERLFGAPFIANPNSDWPGLTERIIQLRPLGAWGLWNLSLNALRYFGWSGDQGVQLFLIASGFGLTWGLLNHQAGKPLNVGVFFWRRAERIYPLWWGVHILFIGFWFLTGWGLSLSDGETFLSLLGIRVTPDALYYFSPAWWYVGLIIQLYLIYPLLWEGLRKWGPTKLLLWCCVVAFSIRGIGLLAFDEYLDAWSRGAVFITRLPEFVFGICLAAWMFSQPESATRFLSAPRTWILAIAVYVLGTFLSLTLPGMIIAPFCLGTAAFILLYLILGKLILVLPDWCISPGMWTARHTYSIFLIHNPIILALVPIGIAAPLHAAGWILVSIIVTLASALALEGALHVGIKMADQRVKRIGIVRSLTQMGLLGVVILSLFVGAELLVRRYDPQEVMGWGERPSLMPDLYFGWRLIPSQTTHLRWESYDYFVQANSLGFPGPEYSPAKPPDTFRILVTGDAFSSAEGVDTDQAWPRLLEARLAEKLKGKKVEVLNFAITGYGPDQYEAVIQNFVPVYEPDLILLEVFVNDFQDVLNTNKSCQDSIGFTQPEQTGLYSVVRLEHLRSWLRNHLEEPLKETVRGRPASMGYFLGNFKALEQGHPELEIDGKGIVAQRLKQIEAIANESGAKLLIFMVPAPVQVCGENQLDYYPKGVDLTDGEIYDVELPQRMMMELTNSLNLHLYDLRDPLREMSKTCPYQPHNMHWTSEGHQIVATYLTDILLQNDYVP